MLKLIVKLTGVLRYGLVLIEKLFPKQHVSSKVTRLYRLVLDKKRRVYFSKLCREPENIIFGPSMASALDNWNPPKLDKPDYFDTVKFVYKYLDFHISEDQAYTVLNAFIEKWDTSAGQVIHEDELKEYVTERLQDNFDVLLPKDKIKRIVELIIGYLFETGHFYNHEISGGRGE